MFRTNQHHRRTIASSPPLSSSSSHNKEGTATDSIILEREAQITALQREVTALTNKLGKVQEQYNKAKQKRQQNSFTVSTPTGPGHASTTPKRKQRLSTYGNILHQPDNGFGGLTHERSRMIRSASIATEQELKNLTCFKEETRLQTNQAIVDCILRPLTCPT